ncbi:MAG: hypothetical protein Q7S40_02325, partial [Opitutaceae bacterium]|nr:hypothetical protein [Opitutaceae bacterium]
MIHFPPVTRLFLRGVCAAIASSAATAQTVDLLGQKAGQKQAPAPARAPVRAGFQPPGPPENGPAPWISSVVEVGGDKDRNAGGRMYYPTKTKIDDVYYDVPVAIHVPFEIPFSGGIVNVFFDLDGKWEQPEQEAQRLGPNLRSEPMFGLVKVWRSLSDGIYRLDGAPIEAGTVGWDMSPVSSVKPSPFTWQTDGPFPVLFNGGMPENRAGRIHQTPDFFSSHYMQGARPPFGDRLQGKVDYRRDPRPLQFRNAKPGWYALWLVVNPGVGWRGLPVPPVRPDDTMHAKIYAHTMVTRLPRLAEGFKVTLSRPELEYLWEGRGERPARLADEKLMQAHSVEIPVVFQRDGWVLDRVETLPDPNRGSWLRTSVAQAASGERQALDVKAEAKVLGRGATMTAKVGVYQREYLGANERWKKTGQRDLQFEVQVPAEIADGGVAEISVTRTIAHEEGNVGTLATREDPFALWPVTERTIDRDFFFPIANTPHFETKEKYLKEWAWRVGDATGRHWLPYAGETAPKSGEPRLYRFASPFFGPDAFGKIPRRMIAEDVGPVKLFTVECGPWIVEAHYRRWKDVRRRGSSVDPNAVAAVVNELDPFWPWLRDFSRRLKEWNQEILAATSQAKLLKPGLTAKLASAGRLRGALGGDAQGFFDTVLGDYRVEIPADTRARMDLLASTLDADVNSRRERIRAHAARVREIYAEIEREHVRAFDLHGERHFELINWRNEYRTLAKNAELDLALLEDDLPAFRRKVDELWGQNNVTADTRLYEALLMQNKGDFGGALFELRRAAEKQPELQGLQRRIAEFEAAFVRSAMGKSHRGVAEAREQFYQFMEARGYQQGTNSGYRVFQFLTSGAANGVAAAVGLVDANADELGATELLLTNSYVGLQAIQRLQVRGHTLAAIATMPAAKLWSELAADSPNTPALTGKRLAHFGACVQTALQLPELRAIVTGDRAMMLAGENAGYWTKEDVSQAWWEMVGNMATLANVGMMAAPHTYVARAARPQFWTAAQAQAVSAAAAAGRVETLTALVGRKIGLARALGAFGQTAEGEALALMLQKSHDYQQSFGLVGRTAWTGGQMLAIMGAAATAYAPLEHYGGPGAVLLLDAVLMFAGDTPALTRWFNLHNIPAGDVARLVRRDFLPAIRKKEQQLRAMDAEAKMLGRVLEKQRLAQKLSEWEEKFLLSHNMGMKGVRPLNDSENGALVNAISRLRSGATLTPAEEELILRANAAVEFPPRAAAPNGDPAHDSLIAQRGMTEGLTQNTNNGAGKTLEELVADVPAQADDLGKAAATLESAVLELEKAPALRTSPGLTRRYPNDAAGIARPSPGTKLAHAEAALANEDFELAETLYRQVIAEWAEAAEKGLLLQSHEWPWEMLQVRLRNAQRGLHGVKPAGPAPATLREAIGDPDLAGAVSRPRQRLTEVKPGEAEGASGDVFKVHAPNSTKENPRFSHVLKEVVPDPKAKLIKTPADLQRMVEGEVLATTIAQMLGFDMPAMRVVVEWEGRVMKKATFVYRNVEGARLDKVAPEHLFALRAQLSQHRALSVWLGDYDRKLDNHFVRNGRLIPIDAGQADLRGFVAKGSGGPPTPVGEPALMDMVRDNWKVGAFHNMDDADPGLRELSARTFANENNLTYRHAEPTVTKIEELLAKDPGKLERALANGLDRIYHGSEVVGGNTAFVGESVQEMMGVLRERGAALRASMQRMDGSVPAAGLAPRSRGTQQIGAPPRGTGTQREPVVPPSAPR